MKLATLLLMASLGVPAAALAQGASHHGAHPAAPAASAMSDGEVLKVDKAARTLTLAHGPIASIDMPAMTMDYGVADAAMVDRVKPGDKVRFTVDKVGGFYVVTRLEPAK